MTIEDKSREYADEKLKTRLSIPDNDDEIMFARRVERYDSYDIEQAYEDGYNEALQSQWKDPEVELPEEKMVVLCFMSDMKDDYAKGGLYFDIAVLLEGEFINLDAEIIHPTNWMPIPEPPTK